MTVAIVDYGSGNLHSAAKAFERAARESGVTQPIVVTSSPEAVARADRIVLPGVGAFADCRRGLDSIDGMIEALNERVHKRGHPFLGICVGMQMLFDSSEEDDSAVGLGVIPGTIRWLGSELPRPQMQWNLLTLNLSDDQMFVGLSSEAWVYFVHSLHAVPEDHAVIAATCTYGGVVNAAFRYGNVFATQFHPEKSGSWGISLLGNFVRIAAGATKP